MKSALVALTALVALGGSAALAAPAEPYTAINVDDVATVLAELGAPAERTIDDYGDPLLTFTLPSSQLKASVYFYDCADNQCGSIQLHAGFTMATTPSYEVLNDWNGTKRWARGYRSSDGAVHLETDLQCTPGYVKPQVKNFVQTFDFLIKEFASHVGFK